MYKKLTKHFTFYYKVGSILINKPSSRNGEQNASRDIATIEDYAEIMNFFESIA